MTTVTFRECPDRAYDIYMEQGFFCEPDVLSAKECDAIIEAAKSLPSAQDGSYIPMMNVHKSPGLFFDAMSNPQIVGVMDRIIHGRAKGLHSQLYYTPPNRAGLGFHQDNYFVEAKGDAFASAWIPLVEVTAENGGLYCFVGSHNDGKLPVRNVEVTGQDKRQAIFEETVLPKDYKRTDIFMKRGSVLYIHGYVVHGSYQNKSTANRFALLNTYIRENEQFRAGNTAKREEIELTRA
jgi:hypothetical protein